MSLEELQAHRIYWQFSRFNTIRSSKKQAKMIKQVETIPEAFDVNVAFVLGLNTQITPELPREDLARSLRRL